MGSPQSYLKFSGGVQSHNKKELWKMWILKRDFASALPNALITSKL
jgi:hypothetical protein